MRGCRGKDVNGLGKFAIVKHVKELRFGGGVNTECADLWFSKHACVGVTVLPICVSVCLFANFVQKKKEEAEHFDTTFFFAVSQLFLILRRGLTTVALSASSSPATSEQLWSLCG